jgi:hypothetical protein
MIGVVDGPAGEPEHLALERGQIGQFGAFRRRHMRTSTSSDCFVHHLDI